MQSGKSANKASGAEGAYLDGQCADQLVMVELLGPEARRGPGRQLEQALHPKGSIYTFLPAEPHAGAELANGRVAILTFCMHDQKGGGRSSLRLELISKLHAILRAGLPSGNMDQD